MSQSCRWRERKPLSDVTLLLPACYFCQLVEHRGSLCLHIRSNTRCHTPRSHASPERRQRALFCLLWANRRHGTYMCNCVCTRVSMCTRPLHLTLFSLQPCQANAHLSVLPSCRPHIASISTMSPSLVFSHSPFPPSNKNQIKCRGKRVHLNDIAHHIEHNSRDTLHAVPVVYQQASGQAIVCVRVTKPSSTGPDANHHEHVALGSGVL